MTYAVLGNLKKNSVPTTTTSDLTTGSTTIPVTELSVFYDKDGGLITKGIVLGADNNLATLPEEITITGASGTSGAGNLTGVTRAVNADGTTGAAYAWPTGTKIQVNFTIGIYNQIRDNFAALPQSKNAIINGDCRVNQRVTSYTLAKDVYTWDVNDLTGPDRHEGMATGTAVSAGTWGQSTTCTAGNSGYGFKFAGVTLTGTGILYHRHRIEAKDAARFKNMSASFSVKVYHDVGSNINYTIYVRKANAADNFSAVTAISNSGAISVPTATATSLKYENISMGDCSNGIEIEIKIECGAVTLKNFCQTELQFEMGTVCTAFEIRSFSTELALCMYRCEKSYDIAFPPGVAGNNNGVCIVMSPYTGYTCGIQWKTYKPSVPTIYLWAAISATASKFREFAGGDVGTVVSGDNIGCSGAGNFLDSGGAFTTGKAYMFHYLAACEL